MFILVTTGEKLDKSWHNAIEFFVLICDKNFQIKSSIKLVIRHIPVKIFYMKVVNLKEEMPMPRSDTVFSYLNKWTHERHSVSLIPTITFYADLLKGS